MVCSRWSLPPIDSNHRLIYQFFDLQVVRGRADYWGVTIIKRFMDSVHERSDSFETDVFGMLPPNCEWTVGVRAQIRAQDGDFSLLGVLGHDGELLAFAGWNGRQLFSEPLTDLQVLGIGGDRLSIRVGETDVQLSEFAPLSDLVPDAPKSTAEFREHDPFAGLLSWLPTTI